MVARLDFLDLKRQDPAALDALKTAAKEVEFVTVYNTGIRRQDVSRLLDLHKALFKGPDAENRRLIWRLPAQTAAEALRGQSKSAPIPTQIIKKYLIAG